MVDENLRAWAAIDGTRGIGPRAIYRIAQGLRQEGLEGGDLLSESASDLERRMRLFGASEKSALLLAESLTADPVAPRCPAGVVILHPDRPEYPLDRLHPKRPLPGILYVKGSPFLLDQAGVAIVGSRDATDDDVRLTHGVARELGARGSNVVSGHARGVDHAAHAGAIAGGGTTTAVLAEGIERFNPRDGVVGDEHSFLAVSQFSPDARWRPHQAMARNATVAALSECVVVIRSGDSGGTCEMIRHCAKAGLPIVGIEGRIPASLRSEIDMPVTSDVDAVVEAVDSAIEGSDLRLF